MHGGDSSNVIRASGVIADSYELIDGEGVAVGLIVLGVSTGFGSRSFVGEEVGDQPLISSLRCVIHGSICRLAKAFGDSAGSAPCRDVFCAPSRGEHLILSRRHTNFDFIPNPKTSSTATFIQPGGRFLTYKIVVGFGQLDESLSGHCNSVGEQGRESQLLRFVDGIFLVEEDRERVARRRSVLDLEGDDAANAVMRGGVKANVILDANDGHRL